MLQSSAMEKVGKAIRKRQNVIKAIFQDGKKSTENISDDGHFHICQIYHFVIVSIVSALYRDERDQACRLACTGADLLMGGGVLVSSFILD